MNIQKPISSKCSSPNKDVIKSLMAQTSITSLKFIDKSLLAAGCGSFLTVYDWHESNLLHSLKVFEFNKIHGIRHLPEEIAVNNKILIWGGNEIAVLTYHGGLELSAHFKLKDRIIDVTHHEKTLYALTAHNEVLTITSNAVDKSSIICEERSILYSGSLFVSSTKRLVAAGTVFGGVVIWDLDTQTVLSRLQKHEGSIFHVAWNASGTKLASCSDDRAIIVSDLVTEEFAIGWGHISRIWKLQFLNHNQIISASEDCSVRVWRVNADHLHCEQILTGHRGRNIWSLDVEITNKVAASGGGDGRIMLWDLDSKTTVQKWDVNSEFGSGIRSCAVSQCGSIALSTSDGRVFWRLDGPWKLVVDCFNTVATTKHFDNSFYVISSKGEGVIIDSCSGHITTKFLLRNNIVDFFILSPRKLLVIPVPPAKQLIIYSSEDRTSQLLNVPPQLGQPTCATGRDDFFWVGTRKGDLLVCQYNNPSPLLIIPQALGSKTDAITSLHYRDCSQNPYICVTSRCSEYGIFDPTTLNRLLKTRSRKRGSIEGTQFHPQGQLMWGFQNDTFIVWNSTLGFEFLSINCGGSHRSWDFQILDSASQFCYVRAAELICHTSSVPTTKFKQPLLQHGTHGREIRGLEVSPNEPRLVATGSEDTTVNLGWINDQNKFDHKCTLTDGHISGIQTLHWSPCGRYLFTGAGRGELVVWQVVTFGYGSDVFANEISRMPSQKTVQQGLRVMDFAICDNLIAVAYSDSSFRIWKIDNDSESSRLVWTMLLEDRYKQCCLLNIDFILWKGQLLLFISATDGCLVVYSVSREVRKEEGKDSLSVQVKSKSTIHQSSVRSSAIAVCSDCILYVSGGDDNSICAVEIGSTLEIKTKFQIRDAHASAVTGICIKIEENNIISAGSDQKVRLWSLDGELLQSIYTGVSDTSTLTVLNNHVITGGIGIEIFKYQVQ